MIRIALLTSALSFILFSSCSNKDSPQQPGTPVDTLALGWRKIALPPYNYSDIFFINNNTGFILGSGNIFKSVNGGDTWNLVYHAASSDLTNIAMGNEMNVVVVNTSNKILFTKNGGASFDSVNLSGPVSDAFFISPTIVYGIGEDFWKSTDAGSTWVKLYDFPSALDPYKSLFFLDSQNGWIAGNGGVFKTINGGLAWDQKNIGTGFNFNATGSVHFTDINNGFVSDGTSIGSTVNAGASWNKIYTGLDNFKDVHFITPSVGYITDASRIYKTSNGGISWTSEVVLPSTHIIELHFTDANHGWACAGLAILKYQN